MTPKHWDAFRGHSERASAYLAGYYEGRCAEMERTLDRESSFARILRDLAESREAEEPEPVEVGPELQAEIDRICDETVAKAIRINTPRETKVVGTPRKLSSGSIPCDQCDSCEPAYLVMVDGVWRHECAICANLLGPVISFDRECHRIQNAEPEIETTPENLAEVAEEVLAPVELPKAISESIQPRMPQVPATTPAAAKPKLEVPAPRLPHTTAQWKAKYPPRVYTFALTCLAADPYSKALELAAQSQREFGKDCLSTKDADNFITRYRDVARDLAMLSHDKRVEWLGEFDRINRERYEKSQVKA